MTAMTLITKYPPSIQRSSLHLQACVLNLDFAHIKEQSVCDQNAFKSDCSAIHTHGDEQFKPLFAIAQDTAHAYFRILLRMTFKIQTDRQTDRCFVFTLFDLFMFCLISQLFSLAVNQLPHTYGEFFPHLSLSSFYSVSRIVYCMSGVGNVGPVESMSCRVQL